MTFMSYAKRHRSPAPRGLVGTRTMAPLALSTTLNPINTSVVAVALVPIGAAFGAGPAQTLWLVSAFYLVSAVFQPLVGLLVDRFGARRVLIVGAVGTLVSGLAALLPVSLWWLVGVRAAIALSTCAGFPAAMKVLRDRAGDGAVPGRLLAVISVCSQTVAVLGPTLGGLLIGLFGWPSVFAVNIPLSLAMLVMTLLWVPAERTPVENRPASVDGAGITVFVAAVGALLAALMVPAIDASWLVPVGVVAAVLFVIVERGRSAPFVPMDAIGRNGPLLRTYLRQTLAFLVFYGVMFGVVQWLEVGRGLGEVETGLVILPMPAAAVLFAMIPGRATALRGRLALTGLVLTATAVALLWADAGTPIALLLLVMAGFGAAQGMMNVANQKALYRAAPAAYVGTASGLFRTAQYIGALGSSTVIVACFGPEASTGGLHRLAIVFAVCAAAMVVLTVLDRGLDAPGGRPRPRPRRGRQAATRLARPARTPTQLCSGPATPLTSSTTSSPPPTSSPPWSTTPTPPYAEHCPTADSRHTRRPTQIDRHPTMPKSSFSARSAPPPASTRACWPGW